MHTGEQKRSPLGALAADIRAWDIARKRLGHTESRGGRVSADQWQDSDARAVEIVHAMQTILGATATAPPVRYCPPGAAACADCAAIDS
jgi:hypothetical protein